LYFRLIKLVNTEKNKSAPKSATKSTTKKHHPKKNWMQEHVNDHYVQKANAEGWRSRAVFKLSEIDAKDKLLKPGMTVVDLGAAPGSWCQYATKRIQPGGQLIALDLLEMDPIHGVDFIQGDFREDNVLAALEKRLAKRQVDLVLSDMAPNMSGIAVADQARSVHLAELALEFSGLHLRTGGDMLIKVFQGSGFTELRDLAKQMFATIQMRKPAASRDRSPEVFLLARNKY
jgi:23S rRNA (uridine2552-2'-O)-methyltransferase